jgi:hypothetical protein
MWSGERRVWRGLGTRRNSGRSSTGEQPTTFVNVKRAPENAPVYCCPCCKYKTLHSRGWFDTCPVCFWEDDGQDEHDADEVRGGPNRDLSLREAQRNFAAFGASDTRRLRHVRKPAPEEQNGG